MAPQPSGLGERGGTGKAGGPANLRYLEKDPGQIPLTASLNLTLRELEGRLHL